MLQDLYPRNDYLWFYIHKIKLKDMIVNECCRYLKDIPADTYRHIVTLSVHSLTSNCEKNLLVKFLDSCSRLSHLIVQFYSGEMEILLCSVRNDVWEGLTKLSLTHNGKMGSMDMLTENICRYCCRLTSLNLSARLLSESHLKAIMLDNPMITDLSLEGDGVNANFLDFLVSGYVENMIRINLVLNGQFNLQSLFPLFDSISSVAVRVRIAFSVIRGAGLNIIDYTKNIPEEDINMIISNNEDCFASARSKCVLKTLKFGNRSNFSYSGCMIELWERHMFRSFSFLENLSHVQLIDSSITDASFTSILKANSSLLSICVDIGFNKAHPNYPHIFSLFEFREIKLIKVLYKGCMTRPKAVYILL
jgi:hypothetical protein